MNTKKNGAVDVVLDKKKRQPVPKITPTVVLLYRLSSLPPNNNNNKLLPRKQKHHARHAHLPIGGRPPRVGELAAVGKDGSGTVDLSELLLHHRERYAHLPRTRTRTQRSPNQDTRSTAQNGLESDVTKQQNKTVSESDVTKPQKKKGVGE